MAIYNWYFSQSGNDTTGNGSASNPWKTLAKAKTKIKAINSTDTANMFFKRGDTWTMKTAAASPTLVHGLEINSDDPIVNIGAYGSGAKPKFYGSISRGGTWFDAVPASDIINGPLRWSSMFRFLRNNCSAKNIHIDGVYAHGITLGKDSGDPVDYFTLDSCDITNFGNTGISASYKWATQHTFITKNTIHTGQQLQKYGKWGGTGNFWGAAIMLNPAGFVRSPVDNNVSYNVVYDIAGEGIHCFGAIIEHNIVGDTGSVGIYVAPWSQDATDTIVRYNLVVMSDLSSSEYGGDKDIGHDGIGIADEQSSGSNSDATVEVYGNIIINRLKGIFVAAYRSTSPWAAIKIYNNTIIDSSGANLVIAEPAHDMVGVGKGFICNNSSILYNRTDGVHAQDWSDPPALGTYWTIDNNLFWTTGGNPVVDPDWQKNMITGDPKLFGEPTIDGTGQSGSTYYKDIKFSDLRPLDGSALIGSGKPLGIGFATEFLAQGTDFSTLPTSKDFVLSAQPDGAWDIGAFVHSTMEALAKGRIVGLTYPESVKHGAQCDINASTKNTGTVAGLFEMQLFIDSVLKAKSPTFTLEGGATTTDKIEPFTAPPTGKSMAIMVKCNRLLE